MQSVASAHRAAVRTLQTFVSHAPLYYNTSGQLPSIYKELGGLLHQLTSLSMSEGNGKQQNATVEVYFFFSLYILCSTSVMVISQ